MKMLVLFATLSSQLLMTLSPEDLQPSTGLSGYLDTCDIHSQCHICMHIYIDQNKNKYFKTKYSIQFILLYYVNTSVTYLFIPLQGFLFTLWEFHVIYFDFTLSSLPSFPRYSSTSIPTQLHVIFIYLRNRVQFVLTAHSLVWKFAWRVVDKQRIKPITTIEFPFPSCYQLQVYYWLMLQLLSLFSSFMFVFLSGLCFDRSPCSVI